MEQIVNNQAFEHIVEKIFLPLKYEDLIACELVNKMAGTILKNPLFWLKKWKLEGLSKENEEIWNKALRLTKDSELKTNIISSYTLEEFSWWVVPLSMFLAILI